ncbi:hypothetical protein ANAEL_01983 [Anaerolineales bacterium]|nr:hypothetical protein ANAEL_01983 [Anaerolineales bacterium]
MEKSTQINASFTWTLDDLKTRQQVLNSNLGTSPNNFSSFSFFSRLVYGVLIIAIAATVVKDGQTIYSTIQSKLPLIGVYLLLLFIVLLTTLSIVQKRNLVENPDKNKHVDITITSNEIVIKTDSSPEIRWSWTLICEVQKTINGFYFFQAPHAGFWIPIRAFQSANDIEAVSELARSLTPKFSITTI